MHSQAVHSQAVHTEVSLVMVSGSSSDMMMGIVAAPDVTTRGLAADRGAGDVGVVETDRGAGDVAVADDRGSGYVAVLGISGDSAGIAIPNALRRRSATCRG